MIVSIDWLRTFVDFEESIEELAELLSNLGLEAEVSEVPNNIPGVIIGKVEETEKHPNADKLQICKISDGKNTHQVICGAPNINAGQKIAFATVGSKLPGNFIIKKASIRGVDSYGMVCSESELGLSEEHEGILVLPNEIEVGKDFVSAYGYKFISIAIDVTPNRPDAFSYIGIARDIACFKNTKLKQVKVNKHKSSEIKNVKITMESLDDCPRYIAGIVDNIEIKDSPSWMIERLKASGLRSINNVVDISNYVMLEMGLPSHIFDYDSLKNKEIKIRRASLNEPFKTLDGLSYKLKTENLIITDGQVPIALAGIMGGANSSVKKQTNTVLVESAYFNPVTIRKSSKVLGISTDASKRFERGADPNICEIAFWRIIKLLNELASGTLVSKITDKYPKKIKEKDVFLRSSQTKSVLGCTISDSKIEKILKGLDIAVIKNDKGWNCSIPSFRPDIEREIDLIEEIARVYGYNSIPVSNSIGGNFRFTNPDPESNYDILRGYCSGLGFQQVYSNSLQNFDSSSKSGLNPVKMMNPLNQDMGYLRTELITGLVKATAFNIQHGADSFKLFELSNVHEQNGDTLTDLIESKHLACIVYGKNQPDNVHSSVFLEDFYSLKGVLESIFVKKFSMKLELERSDYSLLDNSYSIILNRQMVGYIGHISDSLTKNLKVNLDSLHGFFVNLEPIKNMLTRNKTFKKINLFPESQRDLNLVLSKNQNTDQIVNLIKRKGKKIIKSVIPVNVFTDPISLGEDYKSVTFSIKFQHKAKTLEDKDVNPIINEIINVAQKEFSAKLRV